MDCSCTINVDHDDGPDFYNEKICVARKTHVCSECRREIVPGECYERFSGKWDFGFQTSKTCADCLSVRSRMFPHGYFFERLWEDVYEHICETETLPEDCLAALSPAARERCCTILESTWERFVEEDE